MGLHSCGGLEPRTIPAKDHRPAVGWSSGILNHKFQPWPDTPTQSWSRAEMLQVEASAPSVHSPALG